eukprot:575732-Prorocentrum_minimum.AAC.1
MGGGGRAGGAVHGADGGVERGQRGERDHRMEPHVELERQGVYSLSPSVIGARYGYILYPLLRRVPTMGIFSLPCCDWCPLRGAAG